jgi:hypothetical protein
MATKTRRHEEAFGSCCFLRGFGSSWPINAVVIPMLLKAEERQWFRVFVAVIAAGYPDAAESGFVCGLCSERRRL